MIRRLALVVAAVAAASAGWAQVSTLPLPLGAPDAETAEPCVALAPNGRIGCAWVSRVGDRQSIVFRERIGEAWSGPETFAGDIGSRPASPVLLYDKGSNPRLVWRDGPANRGFVAYAYRFAGVWVRYGPISEEGLLDAADPSAAIDSQGRLHATWREGAGSFWRIMAATFETDGSLHRWDLTEGRPERLNLYPTVLGAPRATVLWFAEEGGALALDGRAYDAQAGGWVENAPAPLRALPADRLPVLFGQDVDRAMGVWFDAPNGLDRIYLGPSPDPTAVSDDNPGGANTQPYGVTTPQGLPVLCWRGETAQGPAVFVRKMGARGEWLPSAVLSVPEPPYPARPRIAADDTTVHVVWSSDTGDGGTGNTYYSAVQWAEDER